MLARRALFLTPFCIVYFYIESYFHILYGISFGKLKIFERKEKDTLTCLLIFFCKARSLQPAVFDDVLRRVQCPFSIRYRIH